MNRGEPDLSFIQPDVNLRDVSRLETKKVVHLTNEFLLRIADISNSFMGKMENKIFDLEKRIEALDTQLILVEHKLEHIKVESTLTDEPKPELINEAPKIAIAELIPIIALSGNLESLPITTSINTDSPVVVESSIVEQKQEVVTSEEKHVGANKIKISEHPNYVKYFKMLRLGIPEPAVKIKMSSEGFDPTILDNPNVLVDAVDSSISNQSNIPFDESDSDSSFSSSSSG